MAPLSSGRISLILALMLSVIAPLHPGCARDVPEQSPASGPQARPASSTPLASSTPAAASRPAPASAPAASAPVSEIVLRVKVVAYHLDDMHASYDEAPDEWFDSTKLTILAPAERAGDDLQVFHDRRVPKSDPWRTPGTEMRIAVRVDSLDPPAGTSVDLFRGGVRVLE